MCSIVLSARTQVGARLGQGAHGEVWRATWSSHRGGGGGGSKDDVFAGSYILKRIFVEKGDAVRLAGLREIYMGQLLGGGAGSGSATAGGGSDGEDGGC